MKNEIESTPNLPDTAAVFASALSLWQACHKYAEDDAKLNLSECYNGMDQFMREVMRIANQFETWACMHINFDEMDDVWPYLLEDGFGKACLAVMVPTALVQFDDADCLRVAIQLRLPVILDNKLPIPIDVSALNPIKESLFCSFRIQTVRDFVEDDDTVPFVASDDPFDAEYGKPYFGFYGVNVDGLLEHIADRKTYKEVLHLAQKLAPGVMFPSTPTFTNH